MRTIVLRGPGGAGKTTLGEALRSALGYPSALIDTDLFNWTTVPGESNKRAVFDAVRSLAEVYLGNEYNVIVSGLILTDEDRGGIELVGVSIPLLWPLVPRLLLRSRPSHSRRAFERQGSADPCRGY